MREHHAAVHAAALRVTRDDALALDVTQQVFVRVLEGQLDLAQAQSEQRVLRCAAAREALMALRAAASRRRREEQHAMRRPEAVEDRTSESKDTLAALRRALGELPDELRAALVLRFQEELTFDEMSDVLTISAPSAHQRVQRGLEKLREKLSRVGLGALCANLEGLLGDDGAVPRTPAGLESQLLSLSGASSSSLAAGVSALVAVALTAFSVWRFAASDTGANEAPIELAATPAAGAVDASPTPAATSSSAQDERRAVTPARSVNSERDDSQASQALPPGRIEGRVVDEFGLPLEGVLVIAASTQRDGKFAADSAEVRSARDGSFSLSVPVRLRSGQDYRLSARTAQFQGDFNVVRVRAGASCEPQRITIDSQVAERPGAWSLELVLRDPEGRPVHGADAQAHAIVRHASGSSWPQHQSGGMSGHGGVADLQGEGLGAKLIVIDARKQGFCIVRERLELSQEGLTRREFVLQRGVDLTGSIVDHAGVPITRTRLGEYTTALFAKAPGDDTRLEAEFPEPGRFRIAALAPETPHELQFRHSSWSAFTLVATPGQGELKLRLKLKGDATDSGEHDAEIHGELVDAATGAPVENKLTTTWFERVPADSPALVDRDWAPLVMQTIVAQVAMGLPSGADLPPAPARNRFICDGLAPGRYVVRVFAEGYAPALVGPIEVQARQIATGFTVRLTRGATVSGRVLDANGAPIAGARVHILGDGGLSRTSLAEADAELRSTGGRGLQSKPGVQTDAQGRFTRSKVPTDRALRLYVLHPDREPESGAWLELSEGGSVQIELRAGALRER